MSAYLHDLLAYGAAHPHMVGLIALLAAFLESLAVVGALVPGSILLVGIGVLVPTGAISLWPILIWSIVGAVAGDGLSYWLGYHYRDGIRAWWPFRRHPQVLARTEAFFQRHGGKSVFLGRFLQALRSTIPLVAGMARMPPRRFLVANLSSALLWAPAHVLPGVAFGATVGLAAGVSLRLVVLVGLLLVVIVVVVWGMRALLSYGVPRLVRGLDGLESWAARGVTRPRRLLAMVLGSARDEGLVAVALGVLAVLALWLFVGILEDVLSGDPLVRADTAVYNFLQGLRTAWADTIMVVVTGLGDGPVVVAVAAAALAWLAVRRAWRAAAYLLAAIALAAVFSKGLKGLLQLPRPVSGLYTGWEAFTFPSGHATNNAVLYGFLALLALPELAPRWRIPLVALAASWIVAIGLSRLYLGAHWFADVLAGMAFATIWVAVLGAFYLRHRSRRVAAAGLLASAGLTLAVVGGWHVAWSYGAALDLYAAREETRTMAATAWWQDGWRDLPVERIDLIGEVEEPLTLQWAGTPTELQRVLEQAGWRTPPSWSPSSTLTWLAPAPDPAELPVLPKLNNGRTPGLTMIHPAAGRSRFVLRLWPSGAVLRSSGSEVLLWVGSVTVEKLRSYVGLISLARPQPEIDAAFRQLAAALPVQRLVRRQSDGSWFQWNGQVLLAAAATLWPGDPAKPASPPS